MSGSGCTDVPAPNAEATTWRTAREILALAKALNLPNLPHTERSIRRLARHMGWLKRKRAGTKAWEYHVSALPDDAREARAVRGAAALAHSALAPSAALPTIADTGDLPDWRRRRLDARLAILDRLDRDAVVLGSHRKAQRAFAAAAKAGMLDAPYPGLVGQANAKRGAPGKRAVSVGTSVRWRATGRRAAWARWLRRLRSCAPRRARRTGCRCS